MKISFPLLVTITAVFVSCGGDDDESSTGNLNGRDAAADAVATDAAAVDGAAACFDYESYTPPFEPSFEEDVMPRLQVSCNTSACHGGEGEGAAGLWLGPGRDATSTKAERARVLDEIVDRESRTARGVTLVLPGEPGESFFMLKLDGCQNDPMFDCTPQPDPVTQAPCGDRMPQNNPNAFSEDELDVFRSWIAQGAPNN